MVVVSRLTTCHELMGNSNGPTKDQVAEQQQNIVCCMKVELSVASFPALSGLICRHLFPSRII